MFLLGLFSPQDRNIPKEVLVFSNGVLQLFYNMSQPFRVS